MNKLARPSWTIWTMTVRCAAYASHRSRTPRFSVCFPASTWTIWRSQMTMNIKTRRKARTCSTPNASNNGSSRKSSVPSVALHTKINYNNSSTKKDRPTQGITKI